MRRTQKCRRGTIKRDAYTRRTRRGKQIYVPASCIPNIGQPGKGLSTGGPGIGRLREGDLAQFGYKNVTSMTSGERHIALHKAAVHFTPYTLWKKLNAVYIYTRNTAPKSSRIFKADRDWVESHYGITKASRV